MQKLKLLIVPVVAAFLMIAAPLQVSAATPKQEVCKGVNFTSGSTGTECPDASADVSNIVKTVIDVLSWIVGIISVIMVIVGGLKYILSSGDSNNVNSAKNTILYAIIGLVIVLLAQVIVRFVVNTAA